MHLENPLPVLIGITLMACVCGLMSHHISVLDEVSSAHSKTLPLDGLRGILASSVFFHHAYITYGFFRTGAWEAPKSNFYAQLGPTAVTMFFFISGYLFWRKMLKNPQSIRMISLLPNRARRIMPAYLAAVLLVFIAAGLLSHFHMQQPRYLVLGEVVSWLFSGFPVLAGTHIDGVDTKPLTGGIFWTLQLEWIFYFLLPALVWFRSLPKVFLLCMFALLADSYLNHIYFRSQIGLSLLEMFTKFVHMFWTGFFIGMLTAYCNFSSGGRRSAQVGVLLSSPWMTLVALAFVAAQLFIAKPGAWYGSLLLAPVFLMVVAGNNFLRLLTCRPFRSLGTVSYSVYVFHGILLHCTMLVLNRYHPIAGLTPLAYWIWISPVAVIVAVWSVLSFRYIEKPFFFPRPV